MILKGPKFYTLNIINDTIVLWVDEDKEIPPKIRPIDIKDSTEEEKEYWVEQMQEVDSKIKNNFMGVSLKNFEKFKTKKTIKNGNAKKQL